MALKTVRDLGFGLGRLESLLLGFYLGRGMEISSYLRGLSSLTT